MIILHNTNSDNVITTRTVQSSAEPTVGAEVLSLLEKQKSWHRNFSLECLQWLGVPQGVVLGPVKILQCVLQPQRG